MKHVLIALIRYKIFYVKISTIWPGNINNKKLYLYSFPGLWLNKSAGMTRPRTFLFSFQWISRAGSVWYVHTRNGIGTHRFVTKIPRKMTKRKRLKSLSKSLWCRMFKSAKLFQLVSAYFYLTVTLYDVVWINFSICLFGFVEFA